MLPQVVGCSLVVLPMCLRVSLIENGNRSEPGVDLAGFGHEFGSLVNTPQVEAAG